MLIRIALSPTVFVWQFLKLNFSKFSILSYYQYVLKAVLLQNKNKFSSVPSAHAANMKESCENMKLHLEKIYVFEK